MSSWLNVSSPRSLEPLRRIDRTIHSQCLIVSYACRVGRTAAGASLQGREAFATRLACRVLARPGDQGIPAASRPLPCLE